MKRDTVPLVDWNVVDTAMKALPDGLQHWCTKHVVGMCGVGKFRVRWKIDKSNRCPMCGEPEDHLHVPRCESVPATTAWSTQYDALALWMDSNHTAPAIATTILGILSLVRNSDPEATFSYSGLDPLAYLPTFGEACQAQLTIGPQGLLEGLLATQWATLQQTYLHSIGSRRRGPTWAKNLSHQLIQLGFQMWENRNKIFHSEDSLANQRLSRQLNAAIKAQYAKGPGGFTKNGSVASRQFRIPMERIMSRPTQSKRKWLQWMKLERAHTERTLKSRRKYMFGATHRQTRVKHRHRPRKRLKVSGKHIRRTKTLVQKSLIEWSYT